MTARLQEIRRLLWEEWDPIGVNGIAPDDEYHSYADRIFAMVGEGKNADHIAEYLTWAAAENMGLDGAATEETIAMDSAAIALKIMAIGGEEE